MIVTLPPTAFKVSVLGELVVPSGTLPKLRLIGVMLRPAPAPDRFTVASAVVPFLNESVPDALPVDVGVNVTERAAVLPEAIVAGRVIPVIPNPVPVNALVVMFTSPPDAVSVAGICAVEPTLTFPNAKLVGFIESCPAAVVKFMPATLALFTVADIVGGVKLYALFVGVTV